LPWPRSKTDRDQDADLAGISSTTSRTDIGEAILADQHMAKIIISERPAPVGT
jgi:hypothetical protein